jgi:vacuolar-type H+-ATPase subunit H
MVHGAGNGAHGAAHVDTTDTLQVDEAIARVLHAEQSARDAIAQCTIEADRLRQDARTRARAIAERAALRVARAHEWTEAGLRAQIDRLNEQRAALLQPPLPDTDEPARVARALDWLAAELTGRPE